VAKIKITPGCCQGKHAYPSILASHPVTVEREAMLEAENVPATGPTLLDDAEWQDLKRICDR
jgi:hypothetical protein